MDEAQLEREREKYNSYREREEKHIGLRKRIAVVACCGGNGATQYNPKNQKERERNAYTHGVRIMYCIVYTLQNLIFI